MDVLPGYADIEHGWDGGGCLVYRARRIEDQRRVVIKTLPPHAASPRDIERLRTEYEMGRRLNLRAIVRALALQWHRGRPALVLEDFAGAPVADLLGAPMELGRFLRLAVRLTTALAEVHDRGVIHRDIKPASLLVSPTTPEVKIADLGHATFRPERPPAQPLRQIEGTLPYFSPEATGRTSRAVDQRSDLYSLGATLYEMLTGRRLFEARDPMEWVHYHLALTPQRPRDLAPQLPAVVCDIVMKLLAKTPEERYQGAWGLLRDLERCLERWDAAAAIEPFTLAARDTPSRLPTPHRLHGRDDELAALRGHLTRVTRTGTPELVLISGGSGVGKSALVEALRWSVADDRTHFLVGKFNEHERMVPYSMLPRAFEELVRDVLGAGEARRLEVKRRIEATLGGSTGLLLDVIPHLERIVGSQPPLPELPPGQARSRLVHAFRQLFGVFCEAGRPLILFLDDLQWADQASLSLLHDLLTAPEGRHFLIIGTYRDNELELSPPARAALDEIRGSGARVRDVVLAPLSPGQTAELIADLLRCEIGATWPLAGLLHDRTAGNPFFTLQCLATLHERGLLTFSAADASWRWDIDALRRTEFTEDIVALMREKLWRLPGGTRAVLGLAACLGHSGQIAALAAVADRTPAEVRQDVDPAVRDGLLLSDGTEYRFLHDRTQQAAYALIPEAERARVHLRLGSLLWAHTTPELLEEQVFSIVTQLNLGAALLEHPEERDAVSALNLVAGKKARRAAAYASAIGYLTTGTSLLPEGCWQTRFELTRALHHERAICAYLTGDLDEADRLSRLLLRHCRAPIERAAAHELRIDLFTTRGDNARAVEEAIECLQLFGVALEAHPTEARVLEEFDRVWRSIGQRSIEDLIDLPAMAHSEMRSALGVLSALLAPAQLTDQNLLGLMLCHMMNICLAHGNCDGASMAYAGFGCYLLGPRFGRYHEGYRFGKLALDLVERNSYVAYEAKICNLFGVNYTFWLEHLRSSVRYAHRSLQAAIETGDLTFACFACLQIVAFRVAAGDPLSDLYEESARRLSYVRAARYDEIGDLILIFQRFVQNMRGLTRSFSSLSGDDFDEDRFVEHLHRSRGPLIICWYYITVLQARYLSQDHDAALAAAARAEELLWTSPTQIPLTEHCFYAALSRAATHGRGGPEEQRASLAELRARQERLRAWAANCPDNFLCRLSLVSAEVARIEGDSDGAMRCYERGIRAARDNGFVQIEAIGCELAGRFYRQRGALTAADACLREARAAYLRWGADGKVRALDRESPHLLEKGPFVPTTPFEARVEELDLLSVISASQAISSEVLQDEVIRRLLQLVVQVGGAQRGVLVLAREERLTVEAQAVLSGAAVQVEVGCAPLHSFPFAALVEATFRGRAQRITARGQQPEAAGAAAAPLSVPRSTLCLPVLRKGDCVGVLYLENDLITGAFTPDRLAALEILAAQAAISLENAALYQDLQREILERRQTERELSASRQLLQGIFDNSSTAISVKDVQGKYVLMNRQLEGLLRVQREQALGKSPHDLHIKETAERIRTTDKLTLAANQPMTFEEFVSLPDGPRTYLSNKFPLRDESGAAHLVCTIATDITDRKRAETEIRDLNQKLLSAHEDERQRLALALHDGAGQILLAIAMQLSDIAAQERDPGLARRLTEARDLVARLMDDLRRLSHDLHPAVLDQLGLADALRDLGESITGPELRVEVVVEPPGLSGVPAEIAVNVFRIAQSALSNALRHAQARSAQMRLSWIDGVLRFEVQDDGAGFTPRPAAGLGLASMRQRAAWLGGRLLLDSAPGRGTRLLVEIPLSEVPS